MARGFVYEDAGGAGAGWRVMVNADLPTSGVAAATYGDATHVAQVAVNAQGVITSASNVAVSGGAPSGAAGGDLGSTYPNPTVVAVEETSGPTRLAVAGITNGQYLLRSGATITSGTPAGTSPLTTKGDIYGYSTANDRIPVGSNGQFLIADSSQSLGVKWGTGTSSSGGGLGVYGDASDGAQTFDGAATILGMAPAANVYTLTRDLFLDSSTINGGVTLLTSGFRVFCQGTLTNNGTIQWNGNAANGVTSAGAALTNGNSTINTGSGTSAPGTSGGTNTTTNGGNGSNSALPNLGGQGGTGGAGSGGTGGTGGTLTALTAKQIVPRFLPMAVLGQIFTGDATQSRLSGGTGGGAGGGDTVNKGGDGGGGGGVVVVSVRTFAGTGAIQALGGAGGNAAAGNTGGGAGGGGGVVFVISGSVSAAAVSGQTITATGGAHGLKQGTGVNGADGAGGTVILVPN